MESLRFRCGVCGSRDIEKSPTDPKRPPPKPPPDPPKPPSLAQIKTNAVRFYAACNGCGRGADLDVDKLVETLGPDYVGVRLNGRLKCTACGSRNTVIRIAGK